MKASLIRLSVLAFTFTAVGLLAISPSRAADSSSSDAGGMGACCGMQTPPPTNTATTYKPTTCGKGTVLVGNECQIPTPVK